MPIHHEQPVLQYLGLWRQLLQFSALGVMRGASAAIQHSGARRQQCPGTNRNKRMTLTHRGFEPADDGFLIVVDRRLRRIFGKVNAVGRSGTTTIASSGSRAGKGAISVSGTPTDEVTREFEPM